MFSAFIEFGVLAVAHNLSRLARRFHELRAGKTELVIGGKIVTVTIRDAVEPTTEVVVEPAAVEPGAAQVEQTEGEGVPVDATSPPGTPPVEVTSDTTPAAPTPAPFVIDNGSESAQAAPTEVPRRIDVPAPPPSAPSEAVEVTVTPLRPPPGDLAYIIDPKHALPETGEPPKVAAPDAGTVKPPPARDKKVVATSGAVIQRVIAAAMHTPGQQYVTKTPAVGDKCICKVCLSKFIAGDPLLASSKLCLTCVNKERLSRGFAPLIRMSGVPGTSICQKAGCDQSYALMPSGEGSSWPRFCCGSYHFRQWTEESIGLIEEFMETGVVPEAVVVGIQPRTAAPTPVAKPRVTLPTAVVGATGEVLTVKRTGGIVARAFDAFMAPEFNPNPYKNARDTAAAKRAQSRVKPEKKAVATATTDKKPVVNPPTTVERPAPLTAEQIWTAFEADTLTKVSPNYQTDIDQKTGVITIMLDDLREFRYKSGLPINVAANDDAAAA